MTDPAHSSPRTPPHTRAALFDEGLMEEMVTRDARGNRIRVEWGQPDADGFYTPTLTVDYTDNVAAQARRNLLAELQAEVGKLDVHAVSGYEWECDNCHGYEPGRGFLDDAGQVCPHDNPEDAAISRAAVLALVDRHLREGEAAGGE